VIARISGDGNVASRDVNNANCSHVEFECLVFVSSFLTISFYGETMLT
jgi:hypothetical protein